MILVGILPFALSQNHPLICNIQEINEKDGLNFREIFCSFQDSRGFIWLGTNYGLVKYNGHHFKYITKEKNGLTNNSIFQIIEDEEGILWAISFWQAATKTLVYGINLIDIETDELIPLEEKIAISKLPLSEDVLAYHIVSTQQHRINFITTDLKLVSYEPGVGLLTSCDLPKVDLGVKDFMIANNHQAYEEYGAVLWSAWMCGAGASSNMVPPDVPFVKPVHQFEDQSLLLQGFGDSLLLKWRPGQPIQHIALPIKHKQLRARGMLLKYNKKDDAIWVGSKKDFFVYYPKTETYLSFAETYPAFFQSKTVRDIHFSPDGLVWVSTSNGLYNIDLRENPFTHYLYSDPQTIPSSDWSSCRGIFTDEHQIIIGHYPRNTTLLNKKGDWQESVPGLFAYNFLPYLKDSLLIAHKSEMHIWHPTSNGKRKFYQKEASRRNGIWSLFMDRDSTVYIGRKKGLLYWREGMDSLSLRAVGRGTTALNEAHVYQVFRSKQNELLAVTASGAFHLPDNPEQVIKRYWEGGANQFYLPYQKLVHLYEDQEGVFWVATIGGGLLEWDKSKNTIRQYTTEDGLPSNIIYSVYEDEGGLLWLSTYSGLVAFEKKQQLFKVFTEQDGLTNNEFNRVSHHKAADGRFYFGGLNGVNAFYPKDLLTGKKAAPPLYLTSFHQFDRTEKVLLDQTEKWRLGGDVQIRPEHLYISLTFALLEYREPDDIHYDYKLKSRDLIWRNMTGHTLELSDLPYGQDTIVVRAQSPHNQFLPQILKVPIFVFKPFYLQWWFIVICLGCVLLALFLFYKRKTIRLAQKKVELERLVQERTKVILKQAEEIAADKKRIKEQAEEIEKLGQVLEMSKFSDADADWLQKLEHIIKEQMSDPNFKVQDLANAMYLSRTQFHRKLKTMTGLTPGAWLQETRLQRAKELLESQSCNSIKAVALEVGIKPGYFAEAYKKRFGKLPSEYLI